MITEFLSLLCLDARVVVVAAGSCLSLLLLFLAVFLIYKCTQQDSSQEESTKRTCHSKVHKQRYSDADVPTLERISESPDEPEEVTYAQLNTTALSGAASVPAEETPGSCDYTTVKI
uniref:V-set and transmembrane domain containing 1 n=1 Tax=Moschus moschiferus TaxID=68415 RepID=A0A8C6E7I6_MOSMO